MRRQIERARRTDVPLALALFDLDHFKQINDRFGRPIGDLVLIEIARLLQQETYSGEVVGRHGGAEFMILCPTTMGEQAAKRFKAS